jgi:hypothetical protein
LRPLIAYFGHHKAATTWVTYILGHACRIRGLKMAYAHNDETLDECLEAGNMDVLAYVNAEVEHLPRLGDLRGFHVVRDPRDMIVSGYFSHRHSHADAPWLDDHRRRLNELSIEDGIIEEMEWHITRMVIDQMRRWDYAQPNVLELRMEDLSRIPEKGFLQIIRFTDFGIEDDTLAGILREHTFERQSGGRHPGEEDRFHHFRKGVWGDWRNHFTDAHIRRFKDLYQDVVELLGYESDDRW